jgi:uncharacterized membrane protein (UPF0127 family)
MKDLDLYVIPVAIVLIMAGIFFGTIFGTQPVDSAVFESSRGNVSISLEVADSPAKREVGLMYRDNLPDYSGMLFVFPREQAVSFWMKNTLIHLDMIFVNGGLEIIQINRETPPCPGDPCETYVSVSEVKYVIEVNGGFCDRHGIKEGDRVYLILK